MFDRRKWFVASFMVTLGLSGACCGPRQPVSKLNVRRKSGAPEMHNLLQLTDRIYSGGEPAGDQAFDELARLGITTIVSVDGARPDVDRAKNYGMRYVHIPIGYDGISADAGAALARVVREAKGGIYFHCHHGQHRGPAAAAVACIAAGSTDGRGALSVLEAAGTGQTYTGLWKDVEEFRPPAQDAKLPELREVADIPSLAAGMAKLDRSFDNLKLCRDAGWSAPDGQPDLEPAHEALMVLEGLREATRQIPPGTDDRFKTLLAEAVELAESMETTLRGDDPNAAEQTFRLLESQCQQCHAKYRN